MNGLSRATNQLFLTAFAVAAFVRPAHANNYGESVAWQFMTPAERAVRIAQLELMEKRRGGYYAAPVYNTRVDRQYNCSIAATATGNSGTVTALANSPSVTGAVADSTGNDNAIDVADGSAGTAVVGEQTNSGAVLAGVLGPTSASVQGVAWQALNSNQSNSGDQSAGVQHSQACAFGALNG